MDDTKKQFDFTVNENFQHKVIYVGNESVPIIVIDGFNTNPDDLVLFAKKSINLDRCHGNKNYYPGSISAAPDDYTSNLYKALKPIIKSVYGLPVAYPSWMDSSFAVIHFSPDELNQNQSIPHYDSEGPSQLAVLQYLCHPPHLGTAFYRHVDTGYETIQKKRAEKFWNIIDKKIDTNTFPKKYVNEGNDDFEKIFNIELQFNRLIIYPSQALHSSLISPELLTDKIKDARLTLRTFISYQ